MLKLATHLLSLKEKKSACIPGIIFLAFTILDFNSFMTEAVII